MINPHSAVQRKPARQDKADLTGLVSSATGGAPLRLESTGNTAMNRLWTLLHGPCVTVQQRPFGV